MVQLATSCTIVHHTWLLPDRYYTQIISANSINLKMQNKQQIHAFTARGWLLITWLGAACGCVTAAVPEQDTVGVTVAVSWLSLAVSA